MRFLWIVALVCSFCFVALSQDSDDTGSPAVTPEPSMVVLLGAAVTGIGVVAAWVVGSAKKRKR